MAWKKKRGTRNESKGKIREGKIGKMRRQAKQVKQHREELQNDDKKRE